MPYSTSMKRCVGERKEHIISPGTTNYSYIKYKTKSLTLENNTVLLIYHGYYKNDTNVICNELKHPHNVHFEKMENMEIM